MLLLLTGCLLTRRGGIEAHLPVWEGQFARRAYQDSDHFELTQAVSGESVETVGERPPHHAELPASREPIEVPFDPGPFSWGDYWKLPRFPWRLAGRDRGVLYDCDGIRLEALDYYADSRPIPLPWLQLSAKASPSHSPENAAAASIVLTVRPSRSPHAAERPFGLGTRRNLPGGQRVVFWMAGSAAETAAFRDAAPDGPLGGKGRVVLRPAGRNYQFDLDSWKPKSRRPLGKSGLEVELLRFEPEFLAVELLVHHGARSPRRMVLIANAPESNEQDERDEVFGTFWYDATRKPEGPSPDDATLEEARRPRIDVLQGTDQKLYWRAWHTPHLGAAAEMPAEGQTIEAFAGTPAAISLTVERFLAAAKPDTLPMPVPFSRNKADNTQRQVRVRLTVDGQTEEFWLGATPFDPLATPPDNARRIVAGKNRQIAIALRPDTIDLGVQVFLRKFRRRLDPGVSQAAQYSSLIDLRERNDAERSLRDNVLIAMNAPVDFTDTATGRSYRLFQASFAGPFSPDKLDLAWAGPADPPERVYLSWLGVNHDPGRGLKYAGCLLVVVGIFCTYFLKRYFARAAAAIKGGIVGPLVAIVVLAGGGLARADEAIAPLDWSVWQRLPVLDAGRIMPLDTFAGRRSAAFVAASAPRLSLDGSRVESEPAASVPAMVHDVLDGRESRQFTAAEILFGWLAEPEKWEYVPFLPAADPTLCGELLEVPLQDKHGRLLAYVSPRQVYHAAKFWQRVGEIQKRQQTASADQPRGHSDTDKGVEKLLAAYTAYRRLTFDPVSPRDGRERFIEKLSQLVQVWSDSREELLRFLPTHKAVKRDEPRRPLLFGLRKASKR